MPAWINRLKAKWGITSTGQVVAILVTFSLAGLSITQIRRIFWPLLGFTSETPFLIRAVTYLLLMFPTYQIMLMVFGTLLGQFHFFWAKEKAMFRFLTGRGRVSKG